MAFADPPSIIIPSWRRGRLLFFTSLTDNVAMRLDYRVVAATDPGETKVKRTFKAPLPQELYEKCQKTADDGPALQQFFHAVGRGNLNDLEDAAGCALPPCAQDTNPLIYVCSYFNFLRKYSVDQALISNYENRSPNKRLEMESTLSIYKTLAAYLQPARAAKLIDADIPDIHRINGTPATVASLLCEVANIHFDTHNFSAAIDAMKQAIKLRESADKWRRLGDFAIAAKRPEQAIEFLHNAENLAPLGPPASLRLARLLVESGRAKDATIFLDRAEGTFPARVEQLRLLAQK